MSIQAVGWALDQVDIPARPKLVLVSLANHADKTTGYCWLNAETIAQEAACKPRSVYRFIAALAANGYVRREKKRGADGKQRANNYWLLFSRTDAPWVELGAVIEPEDEAEPDAESHGSDEPDIQDVEGENADRVTAATPGESVDPVTRQAPEKHALSCGPGDSGVSHRDIAEPSKTNPQNGSAHGRTPRGYRPPPPTPPPPMGATTLGGTGELFFVFVGTRAYEAWQRHKSREIGRPWSNKTTKDGKFGWYFPSLFPPGDKPPSGEGETAHLSDRDISDLAKTG